MSGKVFSKQVSLVTTITFLIVLNTFAVENPEVKALLADSLRVYNEVEQIEAQKKAASKELSEKRSTLRSKINMLENSVFDEERVRHCRDNIAFAENQIAIRKAAIEFAKIADPDKRSELVQKYENQRKKILAEELLAGKPFKKQIDALKKQTERQQKLFEEVMKAFYRWPKKEYPAIVRTEVRSQFHAGNVRYEWWDAEHKHQAFCYATIKFTDNLLPQKDIEILDDKFHVTSLWPQMIEVRAGCFSVHFSIRDSDLWGREKMRRYISEFVDLDALAKIDYDGSSSPTDDLMRDSLAYSKKYRKIINEKNDIVKPLTAERVKVKQLKGILKPPPADSEQIRKEKDQIDYWAKECQSYRTRLEICTIKDPNERAALLKTLSVDKEKLDAEKKSIEKPYYDKKKALTRGLKVKDQVLNDVMKVYFHDQPDGYEDIGEMSTRAIFYRGRITCSWNDKNGDTACSAMFSLRNRPSVPDDAQMLDNRYYVDAGGGTKNFIWLWTGNIHVYFNIKDKDWQGTEEIDQIIKKFIDLSGLEKISVL